MRRNLVLRGLPASTMSKLVPDLEPVSLVQHARLASTANRESYVYFPVSGAVSYVTALESGAQAEAAMVGSEGVLGAELLQASDQVHVTVQIPGEAFRLPLSRFRSAGLEDAPLLFAVARFNEYLFRFAAQSAACNGLHDAQSRLARWLLVGADVSGMGVLPLTQEYLSEMLGVRRPTVTISANALFHRGAIRYRRGKVEIRNRAALEREACECYPVIRAMRARMFE